MINQSFLGSILFGTLWTIFLIIAAGLIMWQIITSIKVQNYMLAVFGVMNIGTIFYGALWISYTPVWSFLIIAGALICSGLSVFCVLKQKKLGVYLSLLVLGIIGIVCALVTDSQWIAYSNIVSVYVPFQRLRPKNLGKNLLLPAEEKAWEQWGMNIMTFMPSGGRKH